MLVVLSPSKTLDFDVQPQTDSFSQPQFIDQAAELAKLLKEYTPSQLRKLMKINAKLADLTVQRFQDWHTPFGPDNAKQAALVFKGEVYSGLRADLFSKDDLDYAQDHLRILSGLYGVLRPLDLMQPYRLEMGIKLKTKKGIDLYTYWGDQITEAINNTLEATGQKYLINLASDEYFRVLNNEKLNAEIVTPTFKDYKNGTYKFMTVYGKKARGMMARFIISRRLENVEHIKLFEEDGYYFNDQLSEGNTWVFTRG
jgi:uncharacterized protein